MRVSQKARMNRLFTNGRCLDVAIDHGVCNEPSFMVGLEDMSAVVDQLVTAGPDAIQMNYGQADLLQARPERAKPALVMEHGGGEKLKLGGRDYQRVKQWLEDGAPGPAANEPTVAKLDVFPTVRVMVAGEEQQLAVTAAELEALA